MTLPPHIFSDGPSRDGRFDVKEVWSELHNSYSSEAEKELDFLHRQMNEEINSIEMCARNLVDFPDADWELRMEMARQCADEARHALAFRRLFESRGGRLGQFPIINFQFRILMNIDSLPGRLAVQNRSFEAAGIDAIQEGMDSSAKREDFEFVQLFESQLADEVQHVRYANEWVKRLIHHGGGSVLFSVARAVAQANEGLRLIAGDGIIFYPVAHDVRREAGFSDEEIEAAKSFQTQ